MPDFIEKMNATYFKGELSPVVLEMMQKVNSESDQVHSYVERAFTLMRKANFRAVDFSWVLAWAFSEILPKILSGVFGGIVPPITLAERHVKIDEYIANNQWLNQKGNMKMLDIGCGFPPLTTMESAKKFSDWQLTGADPSFGEFIVYDENGDYALFNKVNDIRYFQPKNIDYSKWADFYGDPDSAKKHFFEIFDTLANDVIMSKGGQLWTEENEGRILIKNPVLQYERENLHFVQEGIGSTNFKEKFDVIRCFNVLAYFDRKFYNETLDWINSILNEGGIFVCGMNWIQTSEARYFVYQRDNGKLIPREFSFSIDSLRPSTMVPWFTYYADNYEANTLAHFVGLLRRNEALCSAYDAALDALFSEMGVYQRDENGYAGGVDVNTPPQKFEYIATKVLKSLYEQGFVKKSVALLNEEGYSAWSNCVNHISIKPDSGHPEMWL